MALRAAKTFLCASSTLLGVLTKNKPMKWSNCSKLVLFSTMLYGFVKVIVCISCSLSCNHCFLVDIRVDLFVKAFKTYNLTLVMRVFITSNNEKVTSMICQVFSQTGQLEQYTGRLWHFLHGNGTWNEDYCQGKHSHLRMLWNSQ